jgi:CCR4-NOT transcription complex subunit 6
MKGETDIYNRVMLRDDIAVVLFLESRQTGARLIVSNVHVFWDPRFKDVKVVQAAVLLEQLSKLADKWAERAPCSEKEKAAYKFENGDDMEGGDQEDVVQEFVPSIDYPNGSSIPLLVCGDFNSLPSSGVYELISQGSLSHMHDDLDNRKYGNFTRDGMTHPFSLKSSYSHIGEPKFTNYTPGFVGVLDYIFYSANSLSVLGLLGNVDPQYLERVPGFPNYHFPSDHLALMTEFAFKSRKEKKVVEADFGPQRNRDGDRRQ